METLRLTGTEQRIRGYARAKHRGQNGEWDFIKGYSTGQVVDLLQATADEFASRGLALTFSVQKLDSDQPAKAELTD